MAPSERSPGEVLDGRYRLVHRLGRGGFGDVWRAEELLPDGAPFREVALKLLLGSSGDTADWAEEAKLIASFRHPSLVTIYAAGILHADPPQRFVAMELLEGQNLADVVRARERIPWRRVLGWAVSAATALDVIHLRGVVHLDLKPANLYLCADGALKVLDFGISRRAGGRRAVVVAPAGGRLSAREAELDTALFLAEESSARRRAGAGEDDALAATRPVDEGSSGRVVIGTPGFIAPEILELGEPTPAADAYALAVCIAQLVTGHLPQAAPDEPASWDDSTAVSAWIGEIRRTTLQGELRDLEGLGAALPRGVAALVRRLLSVDPAERCGEPGKLAALLQEAWERPYGVPDPPYFGLSPYPPEGEGLLFGRDDDIGRLGRELEYEPCVVLQGAPGVGKSSLALAGLVPYLALRGVDGKDDWIAARVATSAMDSFDPDAALARSLAAIDADLAEASPEAIAAWCEKSFVGLAILVDPLEEVFAAPPPVRARLDALLAAIAAGPVRPGLRAIAVLAEEHTEALLDPSRPAGASASLRAALRFVGAPPVAAMRDIVAAPAHFAGVQVFDADVIAAEAQREIGAGSHRLPYVALSLRVFWSTREGGALRLRGWEAIGGVRGALARHGDRVMASLRHEDRPIAEELLLRLSATDGSKLTWARADLLAAFGEGERSLAAARVLAQLERERLVRVRGGLVEIGHEALLTSWKLLESARLREMERLFLLERVREAASAWERADRHPDFLLHGERLQDLARRKKELLRGLTPGERAFVAESRRRARRKKVFQWAGGVASAAALLGIVAANEMIDSAQRAEARARAQAAALEQVSELAANSRRTDDPFHRTAYIAAAMARGSTDGMLPLDLVNTAGNLARAHFVTLDKVAGPSFPWDGRWLLGQSSGTTLLLVDFHPPEPEVIEDVDLDFDPTDENTRHFKRPRPRLLRPHHDPIVQRAAFAFDRSFVTRSSSGEVKVFRLRDDGSIALAAIAPVRCAGAAALAEEAPVLACGTDRGIARWDLRAARSPGGGVDVNPFQGSVADVSEDGARVAAIEGTRVLLWSPGERREETFTAATPVTLVRYAPRARVAAVIEPAGFQIVDEARPTPRLFREKLDSPTTSVRWDEGGLDLAVCSGAGGQWYYLRSGGRAPGDPAPRGEPCKPARIKGKPEPITSASAYPELADREVGTHLPLGGWKLARRRFLTRDLVVLDAGRKESAADPDPPARPAAERLLRFVARDEMGQEEKESDVSAVERGDGVVMMQVPGEVRVYTLQDEGRLLTRKGNLLRRCESGRVLAWRDDREGYEIADVWSGEVITWLPREPGFVIGASSDCASLYTQRLDGTLVEWSMTRAEPRELARADGYVYDVRISRPHASSGPGLWLALSSGAIARIDEGAPAGDAGPRPRAAVRLYGYASPRASALADGPRPGEVAYADATGVAFLDASGSVRRALDTASDTEWEDLSVAPDAQSMLLASADRIAALDLVRRELLGSIPFEGKGRFAPWDDEGSVLAWSFDRRGPLEGLVIPRGVPLAKAVAEVVSNLEVERGHLVARR